MGTSAFDAGREIESFIRAAAHEMRSPLMAVEGFSRALVEDCAGRLEAEDARHLQLVRQAGRRVSQIVDDMVVLAKLAGSPIVPGRVDLTALARAVWERVRAAAPARSVEFAAQDGLSAMGDERLLTVVLEHLLGNAWKFTAGRPVAHVDFGRGADEGCEAFFVRDDGAGFESERADRLFIPFRRLHAPDEFAGAGMGLAAVRLIVRRHGGDAWARGAPNAGATIWFTLG